MNLRNKLMLMALLLIVAVMAVSTGVAYLIINHQSLEAAGDLMGRAFALIDDDLKASQIKLATGASQLATADKMPVKVKYVEEYKAKIKEPEIRPTYGEMAEAMRNILRASGIYQAAIYGISGDLIIFAHNQGEEMRLGYVHPFPAFNLHSKVLKPGDQLGTDAWETGSQPPQAFPAKYAGDMPALAANDITVVDNHLCLASRIPITGKVYNMKTDAFEDKQLGLVVAATRLDQAFVERLTRLTGTKVNLFTRQGLSVGSQPGYDKSPIAADGAAARNAAADISEIRVDGEDYYQGVQPVFAGPDFLGAIACLYSKEVANRNSFQMIKLLALASLLCVILMLPVAALVSHRLSRPINRAITELTDMADQVAAAASQVSSASQALADNASSQAASLQQISAALAETTGMAQRNSGNAQTANSLGSESLDNLKTANQSMKALMQSMRDTSAAADNVVKVVQTIDGIAFQINLLALNAAVEAARAGEAGAGFAVVAEEVRNLAMRSAEASRNTHELVEDIIGKIKVNTEVVSETDHLYAKVAVGVQKASTLVREISDASDEQLRDVEQVDTAVKSINSGIQANAANSEESASASEQMSAQAQNMKSQIEILRGLTEGQKRRAQTTALTTRRRA